MLNDSIVLHYGPLPFCLAIPHLAILERAGSAPLRRSWPQTLVMQPPDRQIEYARKGDPGRQRKEAPRRDFIEPIERYDCRNDNQPLRTILIIPVPGCGQQDIHDQAALSASWMKNSASAVPTCGSPQQPQNAPHRKRHQYEERRPNRSKNPVRRIERRFGEPCIPRL